MRGPTALMIKISITIRNHRNHRHCTNHPAGPFSGANRPRPCPHVPKTGPQGQSGQVRATRPCRRILDRPRADRMSKAESRLTPQTVPRPGQCRARTLKTLERKEGKAPLLVPHPDFVISLNSSVLYLPRDRCFIYRLRSHPLITPRLDPVQSSRILDHSRRGHWLRPPLI